MKNWNSKIRQVSKHLQKNGLCNAPLIDLNMKKFGVKMNPYLKRGNFVCEFPCMVCVKNWAIN